MVGFVIDKTAEVVISGDNVNHIKIDAIEVLSDFETAFDNIRDVAVGMTFELTILRKDFTSDVVANFWIYLCQI